MSEPTTEITIADLGRSERRILREWLDDAAARGIDVDDLQSISDAYDAFVEQMVLTKPSERRDPTTFCTMVGMALGEHLVRRSTLAWRVVTDQQGTDLAVVTESEDAILFPADPVAAAWEVAQVGWLPQWTENLLVGLASESA